MPDLLQLCFVHLPVGIGNGGIGERFCHLVRGAHDRVCAVVQIQHLTAAAKLSAHGFKEHFIVVLANVGLHGEAVGGGFIQNRHIADAAHRHMERSGDRGGGEGQNVDVLGHLLELFFLGNAKSLLLVYDQQPKILELHALCKQRVRANEQVDIPSCQAAQNLALLGGSAETGKHFNRHGKSAHS